MNKRREAIALAYGHHPVPVVTAKGQDEIAEQILEEARRHGVYVTEDPQLLALLSRLKVDQEIPKELYTVVSVVLSWVYWLKGMRPGDEKKGGSQGDFQADASEAGLDDDHDHASL